MADFTQALKSYFSAGGVLMLPLAVLAFFLYYLAFDLLFYLKAISKKISSQQFILESLNLPLAPCRAADLKAAFNNFRMQIMPQTAQTATMIAVLAAAAPLLGLLGTVSGLTLALSTLQAESEMVAEGISRALITTQCGLTIAIPAMVIRMYCLSVRQKILIGISKFESDLILGKVANGS